MQNGLQQFLPCKLLLKSIFLDPQLFKALYFFVFFFDRRTRGKNREGTGRQLAVFLALFPLKNREQSITTVHETEDSAISLAGRNPLDTISIM